MKASNLIILVLLIGSYFNSSNAQSTAERIEKAGKIYVQNVPQERWFLIVKKIDQTPTWNSVAKSETLQWDTVRVGTGSDRAGDLLHLDDVDQGLLDQIKQKTIDLFKDYVATSVEFVEDIEDKGDTYFHLEIILNPWDVPNYILSSISEEGKMYKQLHVQAILSEMTPEYKKPKKIVSVMIKGNLGGIDMPTNAEWKDLRDAMPEIVEKSIAQVDKNMKGASKDLEKKLTKAMSK